MLAVRSIHEAIMRTLRSLAGASFVLLFVGCYEPGTAEPAVFGDSSVADGRASDAHDDALVSDATPGSDSRCRCGDTNCCPGAPPLETCCADGGCPTRHSGGFGNYYWFCAPKGTPGNPATYTREMSIAAARAYRTGTSVTTPTTVCGGIVTFNNPTTISGDTAAWAFGGTAAGHTSLLYGGGTSCPTTSGETWD